MGNNGTGWGHAGTGTGHHGKAGKPIYSSKGGGSSKPPKKGCVFTLLIGLGSLAVLFEAVKAVL